MPKKEFEWRNIPGSIFKEEWDLLKEIIKKYNIKSILEFGCGQTTILFHSLGLDYTSLEEDSKWVNGYKGYNVRYWDKKAICFNKKFDLAVIDGPLGSDNREVSFIIAKDNTSKFIIVHDATNEHNIEWQRKHLKGEFELADFIKTLFIWRRK